MNLDDGGPVQCGVGVLDLLEVAERIVEALVQIRVVAPDEAAVGLPRLGPAG
jgi:hypothetical protein